MVTEGEPVLVPARPLLVRLTVAVTEAVLVMVTLPLPELHALLVPASAPVAVCVGDRVRDREGVGDREGERVPESVGEGLAVGVAAAAEGVYAREPDTLGQALAVKLAVPLAL